MIKMLFYQFVFCFMILPWAWPFIVLDLWNDDDEPKFVRYVIEQATGNMSDYGDDDDEEYN